MDQLGAPPSATPYSGSGIAASGRDMRPTERQQTHQEAVSAFRPEASELASRAERDGCGCPPWGECAHWDAHVLWLSRRQDAYAFVGDNHFIGSVAFVVQEGTEDSLAPCNADCGSWHTQMKAPLLNRTSHPTRHAALAEFLRRERILLGREEECSPPERSE